MGGGCDWDQRADGVPAYGSACACSLPLHPFKLLQTLRPPLLPAMPQRVRAADSLVPSGTPSYDPVADLLKQAALQQVWSSRELGGADTGECLPACCCRLDLLACGPCCQ